MRKIKIKVKYLLFTALIIIVSFAYVIPKAIYSRAEELESIDTEASKVLYKRYISMVPFSNKKADAMFKIANQIAPHEDVLSMYSITRFGISTSGKVITFEMVKNELEYYSEIYRHYTDNEAYIKAYKRILDIHFVLGHHYKNKEVIENGLKSINKEMNFIAQKYKMFYLMLNKEYDEATVIGEELIKQRDKHYIGDVYIMLGDIYASHMNFEKAIECYKNHDASSTSIINYPNAKVNDYIEFTVYNLESYSQGKQQQVNLLKNAKDIYKGKSDIHGKVIINGKPLAFAQVYLRDSRFTMLNGFITGDKGYPIWTDAEGNYRIPKLPKGEYDIELDIPLILLANNRTIYKNVNEINKGIELSENESRDINFSFVPPINIEPRGTTQLKDNKLYIKWESVEGAAYYYVNVTAMEDPIKLVGGSFYGPVSEKITTTSYTLNIQDINKQSKGQGTSGDGLVNIQAYLGMFFSGFKIPFSVTAYDKNDNIISSSSAIHEKYENLHLMLIPKAELLEGDELLINKKPEEALKSYEKHLASNPNDIHTIEVLTRMYKIGIRNDWKNNKFEAKDINKALDLANRSYKLTGNIEDVKYVLGNIYLDIDNAKDYQWALEQTLKLPKEEIKKEQYADLGYLYLRLKEFNKADESFNKAISMGYDYLYESPLLKLYLEDFQEALIITMDRKYLFYSVKKDNFIKGLKEIENVDKTSEDYRVFRKLLGSILSKEDGYKEKYKVENPKIKNTILNRIMLEIAKEQNLQE